MTSYPDPRCFEVIGIQTQPHDDQHRRGYRVRVKALQVWMPVEDALRNGVVPSPPPLPSSTPSEPIDRAEIAARLHQLRLKPQP